MCKKMLINKKNKETKIKKKKKNLNRILKIKVRNKLKQDNLSDLENTLVLFYIHIGHKNYQKNQMIKNLDVIGSINRKKKKFTSQQLLLMNRKTRKECLFYMIIM